MRPIIASVTVLIALIVAFVLVSDGPAPVADASFHEVRIYRVMGGSDGDVGSQFVELRQASGSQNQVQNAQLCFYDADGVPWASFAFPAKVDGAGSNDSILIGTAAMAAAWNATGGAEPDFIFDATNVTAYNVSANVNAPVPVPNGAIVYESKADADCGSPNSIDSVAYGSGYNGVAFFGDVFETDLPSNGDGFELRASPVAFPPTDNSTEYDVKSCILARNNAGQEGTVGQDCGPADTPTPSPTPSPTPTPAPSETPSPSAGPSLIWGDSDCDLTVTTRDNQALLRNVLQQNALSQTEPCPDLGSLVTAGGAERAWGDWDCDGSVTTRDNQALLRYVLEQNALSQTEPCPDIGEHV